MRLDSTKAAICALLVVNVLGSSGCGGGSSTPPQPTGTTVNVSFKGATPVGLAEQIGTGTWTAASLQSGQLTLTIPQGETRYAIAYACPSNGLFNSESVIELATQDPAPSGFCAAPPPDPPPPPPKEGYVTGSVDASAIPGTSSVLIYGLLGFGSVAAKGMFNVQTPLQGTRDIAFVAVDASQQILAVKILRSQTVPGAVNGGQTVALVASDQTTHQTISVSNAPPGFTVQSLRAAYETAGGASIPVIPSSFFGQQRSQYAVVQVSEAQAGDEYQFSASDISLLSPPPKCVGQFFGNQYVAASLSAASASAVTIPLPTPLAYSPPAPAAFPSFDVTYAGFAGDSRVNYSVRLEWGATGSLPPFTELGVTATTAYQSGATTLSIPDLTGLAGFFAPPSTGTMVSWSANVYQYALPSTGSLATVANSGCYVEP
jgi:hypothetical protein